MNATFVMSPLLLLLVIVGVIFFIILITKLIKSNPKSLAIILIIPAALILLAIFIPVSQRRPPRVSEIRNRAVPPIVNTRVSSDYPSSDNSPIWSEGIENEFEADVYPSKTAAVRSIALKIGKEFRNIMNQSELENLEEIVIIKNSQKLEIAEQLKDAINNSYSDIKCRIIENGRLSNGNGIAISFNSEKNNTTRVSQGFRNTLQSGTIQASISNLQRSTIISVDYVDQPWIENFSSFANSQPGKNYIIAKSNETCMTSEEAERQAMDNAIDEVGKRLLSYLNPNKLDNKDIIESGIIIDKFMQSFDTSTGKIWREAILLDVSHAKLTRLANIISNTGREKSMDWARMIFSIVGLFVLIVIAYAFLNAATKGYYSLTLKIAGVILAIIFLFIILTLT